MNRFLPLLLVAFAILAMATVFLVVLPYSEIRAVTPPSALSPYTAAEARGRAVYVGLGCVYCHTQQPRSPRQAPDAQRGWGRATTAPDYAYDSPHQLGTMRTGPDLMNVGARLPSAPWHLTHLYQPRAIVAGSIMPAYPFLFALKDKPAEGDAVVSLPATFAPAGKTVVARREALDLVAYLLSLDRSYPAEHPSLRDNGFVAGKRGGS